MKEILAVIPARGGSKGVKRKNLVLLAGKPLVIHSIEHALRCRQVTRVMVSTEDPEIAEVSRAAGAEVQARPANLSGDEVLDFPVFEHVLQTLAAQESYTPDMVLHLRPTSPRRKLEWLDEAIDRFSEVVQADSLRSVSRPSQHPYRVFRIGADGYLDPVMRHEHPMPFLLRRQDLPEMYYYNCVIDLTRPATVLQQHSMTGDRILPFILDPDEVIDIDSPRDLALARFLLGDSV